MSDLGNVPASSTIVIAFTTHAQTGAAIAPLSGYEAADVQLYKSDSATQRASTAGWTMTSPFDSITGLHILKIDLSDNTDTDFYAAGSFYTAVLSADTETIDGLTAVAVIGTFRIVAAENTSGTPAVDTVRLNNTALTGRDIGASVLLSSGSGTGQLDFTSGVVKANLVQYLASAFGGTAAQVVAGIQKFFDIASPTSTMNLITAVTTATTATNLTNAPTAGDFTATMKTSLNAATPASVVGAVGSVTGNVGGNVVGSVGSLTTNNDKTGYALSTAGVKAIWDQLTSALTTSGSIGKLLVDDINAALSTLATSSALTTAQTAISAIKTVTDQLVATQAEPGQGAPAVNATPLLKIAYIFKAWRNRTTQTASQYSLYADDATTVDQKATFSDDSTTADRGEIGTGP